MIIVMPNCFLYVITCNNANKVLLEPFLLGIGELYVTDYNIGYSIVHLLLISTLIRIPVDSYQGILDVIVSFVYRYDCTFFLFILDFPNFNDASK